MFAYVFSPTFISSPQVDPGWYSAALVLWERPTPASTATSRHQKFYNPRSLQPSSWILDHYA